MRDLMQRHLMIAKRIKPVQTDAQWTTISRSYAMGFADNQYAITRYTITEHENIHIFADRITCSGKQLEEKDCLCTWG